MNGKIQDMCYLYNHQKIVMFDIARSHTHIDQFYIMAEMLKNGMIVSTKYESKMKTFPPPHVVFFANILPDTTKWSSDRLVLIDLDDKDIENTL